MTFISRTLSASNLATSHPTLRVRQDSNSAAEPDRRTLFYLRRHLFPDLSGNISAERHTFQFAFDVFLQVLKPRLCKSTSPAHCLCFLQCSTRDGYPPLQLFAGPRRPGPALRSECLCTNCITLSRQHGNRYGQDPSCRIHSGNQQRAVVPRMTARR